jgi:hypothetical protein
MDQLYYELLCVIYGYLDNSDKNKLAYIYPNLFLESRINEKKYVYRAEIIDAFDNSHSPNKYFFRELSLINTFDTLKQYLKYKQHRQLDNYIGICHENDLPYEKNIKLFKKRLNNFNFKYTINNKIINIDGIECIDTKEYFTLCDAAYQFIFFSGFHFSIKIHNEEIHNLELPIDKNILNKPIECYGLRIIWDNDNFTFSNTDKNLHFCCQNYTTILDQLKKLNVSIPLQMQIDNMDIKHEFGVENRYISVYKICVQDEYDYTNTELCIDHAELNGHFFKINIT